MHLGSQIKVKPPHMKCKKSSTWKINRTIIVHCLKGKKKNNKYNKSPQHYTHILTHTHIHSHKYTNGHECKMVHTGHKNSFKEMGCLIGNQDDNFIIKTWLAANYQNLSSKYVGMILHFLGQFSIFQIRK